MNQLNVHGGKWDGIDLLPFLQRKNSHVRSILAFEPGIIDYEKAVMI